MSKKKAGGTLRQHRNRPGPRLGIKIAGGAPVTTGQIILRQRGTRVKPGEGVAAGRDSTLYALKNGRVIYKKHHGEQRVLVS